MEREHTPGPWRIGDAGNTVFGPKTDRPSPQTIATLSVIDHEANGRLIAAAPEMLELLKEWRDSLERVQGIVVGETPLTRVRAAILRAEGK